MAADSLMEQGTSFVRNRPYFGAKERVELAQYGCLMWRNIALFSSLALSLSLSSQAAVIFDGNFSGAFAPSNWVVALGLESNGSVYINGAPTSIIVNGSNDETNMLPASRFGAGMTTYRIIVPTSGTVRFAWEYQTVDLDASWDFCGYVLNGLHTDLSSPSGANVQSGTAELPVNSGDVFGFYIDPIDNFGGAALVTISASPAEETPEPATFALAGAALVGFIFIRRKLSR